MGLRSPTKKARSSAARLACLAGLAAVAWHAVNRGGGGAAYAVKGAWQGEPSALKSAVKGDLTEVAEGLEPKVALPSVSYSRNGLSVAANQGRLNLAYATKLDGDTSLSLSANDDKSWLASLFGKDTALRIRGEGTDLDSLSWEAAQQGTVEDLGDVKLEFNSDKEYNLTVARDGLSVAGIDVDTRLRATNAGVEGRLGARKQLGKAEVRYSVENAAGNYDLAASKHAARLSAPVAGGRAAVLAEGDGSSLGVEGAYTAPLGGGIANVSFSQKDGINGYNISYARGLTDLAPPSAVDAADATVGLDEGGAYAAVAAARRLGRSAGAKYVATARTGFGEDAERYLKQALRVQNKLGFAELAHSTGDAPRLHLGYEFEA